MHNFILSKFRRPPGYCNRFKVIALVLLVFITAACDDEARQLNARIDELQKSIDQLKSTQADYGEKFAKLSRDSNLEFEVSDTQFQIVEKAFEPILQGQAKLAILGEQKPALIFVEWSLIMKLGDKSFEPISFIQRVQNGNAQIRFAQPLPRHGIDRNKLEVRIEPTGWYQGYVARFKQPAALNKQLTSNNP